MRLSDDKKVDILLSALEERYTSMRNIRERVQTIGIWVLGLLLAAGGWFIQSDIILEWPQKIFAIVGIITAFLILRFIYFEDLRKGFTGQQRAAVRLEKALGFFTPKIFDDSNDPLYPTNWMNAGTKKSGGKFFTHTYLLLYVGIVFFVIAIIVNGMSFQPHPKNKPDVNFYKYSRHENAFPAFYHHIHKPSNWYELFEQKL